MRDGVTWLESIEIFEEECAASEHQMAMIKGLEKVEYLPLSGTAARHSQWNLPYNLFVRDIAWAASSPKREVGRWQVIGKELF